MCLTTCVGYMHICEPGSKAMCVYACVVSALLMTVILHHADLREEVSQTEAMLQAKSRELQVLQHYKVSPSRAAILWLCPNFEGCSRDNRRKSTQ